MSVASSAYASWFDVPDLADVLLNVYTDIAAEEPPTKRAKDETGTARSTEAASVPVARSYHCHGIVLSAQSGCFKAQISSTWQQPTGSASTSPEAAKRTVDVTVETGELDALHELLRMMYSQALPAVAAPGQPLFLQCLSLADRLQATVCMELLLAALAAIPSEDINCAVLGYVFQASHGLEVSPLYPALVSSSTKALLRLFSDVPKVIKDKELLQQFCSLPHAAVLAWVQSDELQVHSENCCVFLVSAWVKANQSCTAAQQEQLAHQIRVFHLGPTYLHHILPNLSWFKHCSGMQHLPVVLSCIRAGLTMKQGLAGEQSRMSGTLSCPSAWCSKPRRRLNVSGTGSWVMSASQLKEVEDGASPRLSPPVYVNGFLLWVSVDRNSAGSSSPAGGKTMGLYRGVDRAAMDQHGVPVPENAMLPVTPVEAKVGSPGSQARKERELGGSFITVNRGWGTQDFLASAAPSFLELVNRYLEGGQLHIQATFPAVDSVA